MGFERVADTDKGGFVGGAHTRIGKKAGGSTRTVPSLSSGFYRDFLLNVSEIPFCISSRTGRLLQWNQAFLDFLGMTPEELHSLDFSRLFPVQESLWKYPPDHSEKKIIEAMLVRSDGSSVWVKALVNSIVDEQKYELACVQLIDIDKFKQQESRMIREALHDHVTGLANRALMVERLKKVLALGKKDPNYLFSLLFLKIQGLDSVENRVGKEGEYQLLVGFAKRVQDSVRAVDSVFHLGKNEFAVLLESLGDFGCVQEILERINKSLSAPFEVRGKQYEIIPAIGVVLDGPSYPNHLKVIRDCERALARAVEQGTRNIIIHNTFFRSEKDLVAFRRDFGRSLEHGSVFLVYQPILDIKKMEIIGFEALIRWRHPNRGEVLPKFFLPAAEEARSMDSLGKWVLDTAAETIAGWNKLLGGEKKLEMHVNVAESQARGPLLAQLKQLRKERGFRTEELCFDFLRRTFQAIEDVSLFSDLGAKLIIDDVKMNFLHLNLFFSLSLLPFDMVKVDRSVIEFIASNKNQRDSLHTFLAILNSRGIKVIVKGVETREQLEMLKLLKCPMAQGFFFSKPLEKESVEKVFFGGNGGMINLQVDPSGAVA
ncbi:MAG: EAL domain-containing protein [Desulfovibrionales bacterium]